MKPFHNKYMSLKGRKQQKYANRFDAELYRYSFWESDLKKAYPKKFSTVKQLEDYIEQLRGKLAKKMPSISSPIKSQESCPKQQGKSKNFSVRSRSRAMSNRRKENGTVLNDDWLFGERKQLSQPSEIAAQKT